MARILSYVPFHQSQLDLGQVFSIGWEHQFSNNTYEVINDRLYQDNYSVEWSKFGGDMWSIFGGRDLSVSVLGTVRDGTFTGYVESAYYASVDGFLVEWSFDGISVSAAELYEAARTLSRDDEQALLNEQLSGADVFELSDYDDTASGLGGNDTMRGYGGDDRLAGGSGRDKIAGGSGNDRLYGNGGKDNLKGNNGSDKLYGDAGKDRLNGGSGNDLLDGGSGNDKLTGGAGVDTFVFGKGRDTVTDFNAGSVKEVIDLSAAKGIRSFNDLRKNHLEATDIGLVIEDSAGHQMHLRGVSLSDLGSDDFLF